MSGLINMC